MLYKNSYYQGLLQDLYCGKDGFFVNFMQFLYQFNQINVFYPEFSIFFSKLCEQELESVKSLGTLILRIGGDAKFFSASRQFVSGYQIDYIKNIESILEMDISILEKNCIDLKSVILKIEDVEVKKVLTEILTKKKDLLKELKNIITEKISKK